MPYLAFDNMVIVDILVDPRIAFDTSVIGMLVKPYFGYIINFDHDMMEHDVIPFGDPFYES